MYQGTYYLSEMAKDLSETIVCGNWSDGVSGISELNTLQTVYLICEIIQCGYLSKGDIDRLAKIAANSVDDSDFYNIPLSTYRDDIGTPSFYISRIKQLSSLQALYIFNLIIQEGSLSDDGINRLATAASESMNDGESGEGYISYCQSFDENDDDDEGDELDDETDDENEADDER